MYKRFRDELKNIYAKNSLLFVSREYWKQTRVLCEFLVVFTNEKFRQTINTLSEKIRNGEMDEEMSVYLEGGNPRVPDIF